MAGAAIETGRDLLVGSRRARERSGGLGLAPQRDGKRVKVADFAGGV